MSDNPEDDPLVKKYPDGAIYTYFKNTPASPEKTTKLKLYLGEHTLANQMEYEIPMERPVFALPAREKRAKRSWKPTKREDAILSLPSGRKHMREYCASLDAKKVPFPEKWQRDGFPKNHVEAWDSKNERLRNNLKSERNNTWTRMKKS